MLTVVGPPMSHNEGIVHADRKVYFYTITETHLNIEIYIYKRVQFKR